MQQLNTCSKTALRFAEVNRFPFWLWCNLIKRNRQFFFGLSYLNGTSGLVAMTSASHAEGRQFDPGRVYCLDVGTSARLGQDPDVRLLRSPQARPPVLTSRQQRCCSEPTPPADPSKIQMNQPAIPQLRGLMPQPSVRGACWVWVTRCTPDTCCAPSTQVWEFPGGAGNIRWSQEVARVTFLGSRM